MGEGGKNDMERVGLFSEVGYTTIGDKYPAIDPSSRPFHQAAYKKKQMIPGGNKSRSALQAGYFEPVFKRIMEKEAYSDPVKDRRKDRISKSKKNIGSAFLPSNYPKTSAGAGNHYGTFGGAVTHFSAESKARAAYKKEGPNFLTNPGKKGTGYGYIGVTLGKYQEHAVEPFGRSKELRKKEQADHKKQTTGGPFKLNMHPTEIFDPDIYKGERPVSKKSEKPKGETVKPFRYSSPAKSSAGCKAGTFDTYPTHSVDDYTIKKKKKVTRNSSGRLFQALPGPKSTPTPSVMAKNVNQE